MSKETTATRRTGAAGTIDVSLPAAEATDIHVLIIDDSEDDALVTIRELKRGGYSPTFERVDTAEAMMSALKSGPWDVIICDYIMPSFSGLAALNVFKASGLDLPFILVSGKVGEERAVEAMRAGATDYVMKDKLNRLVPAIRRELNEVKSRIEYRKAAQSLKQSEERYQALAENYSDVIWVTDMNRQTTYISPSITRLLGYSVEELMVHGIDLTPASLKASMNATAQALSAKQEGKADKVLRIPPLELEMKHKDGSIAWASTSLSFIPDSDGRPVEIVAVLHDTTARKKAADILRASEERLKILFESAPDAYYLSDMEAKLVDGNRAAERLTGYKREELIGKSFLELGLITAEQIPKAAAALDRNLHGQPTGPDEFVLKRKDGSLVNVEINTFPATISGHRLVLGNVRDLTERRKAEEAIKKSESRYRLLAENLSDVIWIMDTNLRYTYMSPSVTSLRGYSVEEAMALSMEETTTPASLQTAMRVMVEAEAKQGTGPESQPTSVTLELELTCKDGSTVWVENRVTYLRDSGGRLTGYQGVSRDITMRRKAEEALQRKEQYFRALIENSSDGIAVVSAEGTVSYNSPSIGRMLGYTPEERIGLNILAFVHPEDIQLVSDAFVRSLQNPGAPLQIEVRLQHKDGTWLTTEITAINLLHDPAVEGIVINLHDITERRRSEETLRESEKRYRLLAENVSDVIWVTDMNLQPVYTSPSIARLLGYSAEESMARRMEYSLTPASLKQAAETFTKILSLKEAAAQEAFGTRPLELEFIRKDGSTIWTATTVSVMRDPDGRPSGIMGVLHDISDRKKAEETLMESEERLKILFEYAPDVYCLSTPEGTVLDANKAAFELLGYRKEEVIGKTFIESGVISPQQFERGTAATAYGPNEPVEMVLNRKDGTKVTVEVKTFPVEIKGQTLLLSIARDTTERQEVNSRLEQTLKKLERTMEGTIQSISRMVETRDPYTAGHQWRMTQLACAIAREEGLDSEFVEVVRIVGLLHDLGKIGIPSEILSKPGLLTDIEFGMIKAHSQIGYEILKTVDFPWPIADIVLQHHERLNGSGYPLGLHEEDICPEARILAVADVVEAMSSHRPYRPSLGIDKALEEITRNSGTLYDPDAVNACLRLFAQKRFTFDDRK
jgi:PAS domain S-box-containing protein/putative nucleotidyltransferase with HDIG domain